MKAPKFPISPGEAGAALRLCGGPVPAGIYCCGLLSSRKSDCTACRSMLSSPATPPARGQHIRMKGEHVPDLLVNNKGYSLS